jgi:hypothetical protein
MMPKALRNGCREECALVAYIEQRIAARLCNFLAVAFHSGPGSLTQQPARREIAAYPTDSGDLAIGVDCAHKGNRKDGKQRYGDKSRKRYEHDGEQGGVVDPNRLEETVENCEPPGRSTLTFVPSKLCEHHAGKILPEDGEHACPKSQYPGRKDERANGFSHPHRPLPILGI